MTELITITFLGEILIIESLNAQYHLMFTLNATQYIKSRYTEMFIRTQTMKKLIYKFIM